MGARGLLRRSTYAAALLAVALFSFAYVQSLVMRASGDMPGAMTMTMPVCTSAGMAHVHVHHGGPHDASQKACPYCAAAAHAPICGSIAPIPRSTTVAWTAYSAMQPLGPRGPPPFTARARGPPQAALTI
ncbi:MAG: hypothetical protein JWO83_305 [Caulobacteraceae bacterium]|nr:hypothetical protein [Caulobacteraceae bacterium]